MIIDIVAGLVVLISALISFMRGLIREVLTIAGVVGGILAAVFIGPSFVPTVRGWFWVEEDTENPPKLWDIVPMEIVADAVTYGVIFLAVVIVISVISHFISSGVKAVGLGPVDRTLGVIFGVARAMLLLGLIYLPFHLLMDADKKAEVFKDSNTHFLIEKVASVMAQYLPESEETKEKIEETADDLIKQKLEESDLLGGDKNKKEEKIKEPIEETKKPDAGYDAKQRKKLDKLFNEPGFNE